MLSTSFTNHKFFKNQSILILLLWQTLSVYLMAVGTWPAWVAWVNVGLIILFIVLRPAFEGLLLAVGSIAFYVVLPSHFSDTLSMWRPVVGVLFLKTVWEWWFVSSPRVGGARGGASAHTTPNLSYLRRGVNAARSIVLNFHNSLYTYEKFGAALFVLAILSLALARYPLRGASQLVFLLNTALLYPIVVWAVKSRDQFIRVLRYGALSTGAIIAIGYVQFTATLFSVAYYFWQYWALRVATLYYGLPLAKVLQYSNSWVTVQGEAKTLRMFSIMPSSHAFAMVCVLFLAFALPLLYVSSSRRRGSNSPTSEQKAGTLLSAGGPTWIPDRVGNDRRGRLWLGVALACLALIVSGTRGVWAGMVPVFIIVALLYKIKNLKLTELLRPALAAMLLAIILFEASPLLDRGFAWVRNASGEATLDRVESIINPEETSNAGRLEMWRAASKYALHHPFGVGYANFVVTLSTTAKDVSFDQAASQENKLYQLPQRYVTAHSLYLQLLVELSAIGLILFGLFWLSFFYRMWDYVRSRAYSISPETIYIASLCVVFLWFLAYGVFDVTWLNDKILLYTFLALGLARIAVSTTSSAD